jgi:N-acetylneuraminate 9-O-acetyltransferase
MFSALVGCLMAEARGPVLRLFNRYPSPGAAVARGAAIAGALALHTYVFLAIPDRRAYNVWHPYTAWVPICLFILLRNASFGLRRVHASVLAMMGRHSLELYLLQFHVWLGASAKTNVVPVPSLRAVSAAGMSFVFAAGAAVAFRATSAAVLWLMTSRRAALAATAASLVLLALAPVAGGWWA